MCAGRAGETSEPHPELPHQVLWYNRRNVALSHNHPAGCSSEDPGAVAERHDPRGPFSQQRPRGPQGQLPPVVTVCDDEPHWRSP